MRGNEGVKEEGVERRSHRSLARKEGWTWEVQGERLGGVLKRHGRQERMGRKK